MKVEQITDSPNGYTVTRVKQKALSRIKEYYDFNTRTWGRKCFGNGLADEHEARQFILSQRK